MTCRPFRPFPSPTRRLHQPALRNLGRPDSRFPPAVGTVCGCSWDIMGSYGGQWEWIVKPWNIRALRRSSRHSGVFLEQNEIALLAPPRANAMLARQWGEMMFFFRSPDRSGRAKLGRAAVGRGEECQAAYKPGSVPAPRGAMDDHSSGTSVAGRLTRPTRAATAETRLAGTGPEGPAGRPPLCGLAPGGVYHAAAVAVSAVRSYRTLSPLPAAAFNGGRRRSALCGTFPGVAPAGRYPAPCFRGARTFLPSAPGGRGAAIQPSGGC